MNSHSPAPEFAPAPRRNWTRRLVNLLVALVVVAVAAATFVFSYSGVHAIALFGGVSAQLARYYPGLFDAVLVIACVAAVVLRDGRWWARLWAWLVIVVLLVAIAVTDVLHAMNYSLRPRVTEGIVAAAPVAAVLLAFSLLLTMLRQSRSQPPHAAGPSGISGGRTRGAGEQRGPATLEIPSLPAADAATVEIPALGPSPQLRQPAPSIALPIALPASFTAPPPVAEAAVPMPAPQAGSAAGAATDTAPQAATDTAAYAATDTATHAAPDMAPTREEPVIAGDREAEPPTVLTPTVAETPAVPPAPQASQAPQAPAVAVGPEGAQPPAGPDEAGPDDTSEAADTAPARTATAAAAAAATPLAAAPSGTVPGEVPPSGTSPAETAPSGTPAGPVPSETVPSETVPSETVPSETVPSETVPAENVPSESPRSGAPETATGAAESPTAPVPVPARTRGGIRYAGGAAPRGSSAADYWDAEEASPYAGQVYPAHDEQADADADGRAGGNGHDGDTDGADDSARDKQQARRLPPELDDDAPPFATAPFAPVPRLNRVRSMPVPPADDEE